MKTIISITLFLTAFGSFAQSSFQLPGDGNWYKVAYIAGQHGYIDYIYWHATGNNPSMTKGEIEFINSLSYTIQHHQTIGYSAWNQPQFAYLNFGSYSELWVKATNGVNTGTFQINKSVNVTIVGNVSDSNLADNGGTLITYNKLEDNTNVFVGNTKTYGTSYFGGYPFGAGNVNANAIEVGGPSPTNNSGQATIFFHHHGLVAHQLRYNSSNFFLEAAGNGYGTNSTPNFYVGGNVGIGTTTTDAKLSVKGQVHAQEVKVDLNGAVAPDYVFEKDYKLTSLEEIKNYIDQNKHLPEVPSAKEMEKNGVQLGEMNMLLLKKIEELTLYTIEMNKKIIELTKVNENQQSQIEQQIHEIKKLKYK